MAEGKRRELLGRIAEFGWFSQQGEPAATQCLAMLLEDKPLKKALLRHLEDLMSVDLGSIVVFARSCCDGATHGRWGTPRLRRAASNGRQTGSTSPSETWRCDLSGRFNIRDLISVHNASGHRAGDLNRPGACVLGLPDLFA